MPALPANSRPRITSIPALFVMAAGILLVFVLMFPGQQLFLSADPTRPVDALSVMYLRAELALQPANEEIRLLLAKQLFFLAKLREARHALTPLCPPPGCTSTQASLLALQIDAGLWRQLPEGGPQRKARLQQLKAHLQQTASRQDLSNDERQQLAELALQLELPGAASRLYAHLARQDPAQPAHWWSLSARWALAAGRPETAAWRYQKAYDQAANNTQARQYALQSLDGMTAAGQNAQALRLAEIYLRRFPHDVPLQQRAIRIAQGANHSPWARRWNLAYLRQFPNDRRALKRQRDLELALGNPKAALPWARRLVTLSPNNLASRETLAQLFEWSGDPVAAQREWEWLAKKRPRDRYESEAERLATLNYDTPALIASLRRKAVHRPLEVEELEQLYNALLHQGENKQALQVLKQELARSPKQRIMWVKLAEAQIAYGNLRDGLATWQEIERRFGVSRQTEQQQLVLYWRLNETRRAWQFATSAQYLNDIHDKYPLQILGELGWHYRDMDLAHFAYVQLWEKHEPDPQIGYRLIIIAAEKGDASMAAYWGLKAWKRSGDPGLLLSAMSISNRLHDTQALQTLLDAAAASPAEFASLETYWLLRAELASRKGDYPQALRNYQTALRINPATTSTKAGILWTLISANEREPLQRYLRIFQTAAKTDSALWGAYAAGLMALGRPREALPWYVQQLETRSKDYLWLLNFADTLAQAGRHNSALRVRRYALANLRPEAEQLLNTGGRHHPLAPRYASLLRNTAGTPIGENWFRHWVNSQAASSQQQALLDEFIIGWYLSREQLPMARYWLLRTHAKRLATPRWQRLALALADNDLATIDSLLRKPAGIDLNTRVEGLHRLGQIDFALSIALEGLSDQTPTATRIALRQQAVSLRQELPNFWQLALGRDALGNLLINSRTVQFGLSRQRWGVEALLGENQLSSDPAEIDLRDANMERVINTRWRWRMPRGRLMLNAGANLRNDADLVQAGLTLKNNPRDEQGFTLSYQYNELTDESRALRALGSRDRLVLAFGTTVGSRESAWLQLYRSRYHDRQRSRLGDGFGFDALLEHRLAIGTNEWAVRIQGSLQNNKTVSRLPDYMAARMPPGSSVANVLPEAYRSLGVGLRLNRGIPGGHTPLVGSLRYYFDAWVGPVWPQPRIAFNVDVGVGTRVLGSDELSFSARYSETASFLPQEERSGAWLRYRYFLGR